MKEQYVSIQGKKIRYLIKSGASTHVLVFLHGFPECAEAWLPLWEYLPEDATLIAPDMPGFQFSAPLESDSEYRVSSLAERLNRFIQAVAPDHQVTLIGHDWGGAVAWPLAAFYPDSVSRLIILNAAHPSTFSRELNENPEQRYCSRYISKLRQPEAAQQLRDNEFTLLKSMLTSVAANHTYHQRLATSWQMPGRMHAMLGYYRSMKWFDDSDQAPVGKLPVPSLTIMQPALVLWGMKDSAFVPEVLNGLSNWVGDLTLKKHSGATHWIHREAPEWVGNEIKTWLYK